MSKKYYIDSLSDETLAKMIDQTLKFEKRQKNEKSKPTVSNILRWSEKSPRRALHSKASMLQCSPIMLSRALIFPAV